MYMCLANQLEKCTSIVEPMIRTGAEQTNLHSIFIFVHFCRLLGTAVAVDLLGKLSTETALFFPDGAKMRRHIALANNVQIKDSMPVVRSSHEHTVYQYDTNFVYLRDIKTPEVPCLL